MGPKPLLALILVFAAMQAAWAGDEPVRYIDVPDGAVIALYRAGDGRYGPVVLVHGLGTNRQNFLLGPDGGLAGYLAGCGFEVYIFEHRGVGRSVIGSENGFEQHALVDLPLVLDEVFEMTGRRPQAVGHSLGGMMIGACLSRCDRPRIRAAVLVASPYEFRRNNRLFEFVSRHPKLSFELSKFPYEEMLRALSPFVGRLTPPLGMGYAEGTIDGKVLRRFARTGVEKPPRELVFDFTKFVASGCVCDGSGSSYFDGISSSKVPLIVIAGARDELAPPEVVRPWYELSSSVDKSFVLVSRANGFSTDAGHGDILVGRYAADEIYPMIARWLKER